jgi:hypothetical protein
LISATFKNQQLAILSKKARHFIMTSSTLKLDDSSFDVSKFQTLTGQDNLIAWFRDFKSLANSRNLWDILSGDESIITKPE